MSKIHIYKLLGYIIWSCNLSTYVWMELEKLDDNDLELVVALARKIWFRRNFVAYGRSKLVKSAKDSIEEFHQATQVRIWE
jgi:hypothetical protein